MDEEFSSALLTGMCPIGFLMLGSTLQDLPSDSPAACRSACRRRRARRAPAPTSERSSRAPGLSWSAARSSRHCPTTSHDDGQVHTDASAGPAPPAPASSTRLPPQADHEPAWTQRATTPTRPSQPYGCLPHRRAPGPHFGRTQRTRQAQTPDAGHLDAQTPAPDTGHRSGGQAGVDTGRSHRTPDTGRGRGQGDEARPASDLLATTPSDRTLGRPTVFFGRRLRRSTAHAARR
jgi:hypothetical protein